MQTEHLKNRRVQIGLWVPELAAQNFRNPQQSTLILCSPNSSPTSRGVVSRDADLATGLYSFRLKCGVSVGFQPALPSQLA